MFLFSLEENKVEIPPSNTGFIECSCWPCLPLSLSYVNMNHKAAITPPTWGSNKNGKNKGYFVMQFIIDTIQERIVYFHIDTESTV
jgi:hypothetical protein